MPGYHDRPTFKSRTKAVRHGHITYGKTKSGMRNFKIWKTKGGWSVSPKKKQ